MSGERDGKLIGERIRKMRKLKKWTQEELARHLSLAKSTISQYENGINEPDAVTFGKLAELLDTTTDYLITGDTNTSGEEVTVSPEELEFLKWVDDNVESSFFYDFSKSPEESKREMMETLKFIWEREKKRQGKNQNPTER